MSAPQRIQRQRTKGWRMPAGAVYVGRPTVFGNPAVIELDLLDRTRWAVWAGDVGPLLAQVDTQAEAREVAVEFFRQWLASPAGKVERQAARGVGVTHLSWAYCHNHADLNARIHELRGRDLACWCPLDQPCHADVLLELANSEAS